MPSSRKKGFMVMVMIILTASHSAPGIGHLGSRPDLTPASWSSDGTSQCGSIEDADAKIEV